MGYYDVYLKRQTEIMDESMQTARRELLQQAADEQAYRQALQQELAGLDKTIAHYQKAARSGDLTWEQHKWFTEKKIAARARAASQTLGKAKFGLQVDKLTRVDASTLNRLNQEFGDAANDSNTNDAVGNVIRRALANETIYTLAARAKDDHELAEQAYAVELKRWLLERLDGHQLSDTNIEYIENAVHQITGIPFEQQTNASLEAKRTHLQDVTVDGIPVTGYRDVRELQKLEQRMGELNADQRAAIKIQLAQVLEEGGGREVLSGQLEALGTPMAVTEEAVRARAGEIARPQLYEPTPFGAPQERAREAVRSGRERRLADLVEGRDATAVGPGALQSIEVGERRRPSDLFVPGGGGGERGPFAGDARIRRLERLTGANDVATQFGKLSDDDQIMIIQGSKALKAYRAAGSMLPGDQESIEWVRANEMYNQMGANTLAGGANVIRVATELSRADLGAGAPASDIRRHRDEIMERFLMLVFNDKNATAASSPAQEEKEKPAPEAVEAEVVAPVTPGGADAVIEERAPTGPLASELGATQAEVDAMNPPYIPEYPTGGDGLSAEEQSGIEAGVPFVLPATTPGPEGVEPARRPPPPGQAPEPTVPTMTRELLQSVERMAPAGVTAHDVIKLFVESASPDRLPFGPESYDLLATAAIASGLKPPVWFTTPIGSAPTPPTRTPMTREPARKGPPPGQAPVRPPPPTRRGS